MCVQIVTVCVVWACVWCGGVNEDSGIIKLIKSVYNFFIHVHVYTHNYSYLRNSN